MARILAFAIVSMITGTLCAQESAVVDKEIENPVDFGRVQGDVEDATASGFRDTIQFPGADQLGDFAPSVPILVPLQLFTDLKQGTTEMSGDQVGLESTGQKSGISFSKSGYSAWTAFPTFNLSVQASSVAFAANADPSPEFAGPKPDYFSGFTGDAITFGYAGVDYLVLFECLIGDSDCISEEQAEAIVDEFVLCDRDGSCVGFFPVSREARQ